MSVRLADVAQRAGVSEATASRALNGRRHVATATRIRVEAAIRELDYLPHHAARELSTARTGTVAVLVHHGQYPAHGEGTFTSRVIEGVSRALRGAGLDMLYVHVDDGAVGELARIAAVRPGRSDAALVLGPAFPRAAVGELVAAGVPLVTIDNRVPGADAVLADNRPAMGTLTLHLIEVHGHRRLACLAGPASWPSSAERVDGVRRAARRHGLAVTVLHAPETTVRDGADLAGALLDDPPDAALAVNDAMAIGALHRFRTLRRRQRPAVTGFDDIAWAALTDPPLTSVAVDAGNIGSAAVERLLDRLAGREPGSLPAREIRVPAIVHLRRSCGCDGGDQAPGRRRDGQQEYSTSVLPSGPIG